MPTAREIARYADELLESANTPDYPNAVNGLQLDQSGSVSGIVAAVDFRSSAIDGALEVGANFMVVHHGMFWSGVQPITGPTFRHLKTLIENDIAVYSCHLPLDRHPEFGNNAQLARALGLRPIRPFAKYNGVSIGVAGDADIETNTIADRLRGFARSYGGDLRTTDISPGQRTKRWGMCTGAGASTDVMNEALADGIDTLIVGEGPHWSAVFAAENALTILYAGHYATETLGVCALARHLSEKFNVPWSFVAAPTGL